MKKQLEENEKAMKAMQQSYEEKLAAAKAQVSDLLVPWLSKSFVSFSFYLMN